MTVITDTGLEGYGITFTVGRGNDIGRLSSVYLTSYVLQNVDPDYSCGYVTVITDTGSEGYGITFTAGRGTDIGALYLHFALNDLNSILISVLNTSLNSITPYFTVLVCMAINAYKKLVIGKKLADIYEDFGGFWRELTSETQLRWVDLHSELDFFNLILV